MPRMFLVMATVLLTWTAPVLAAPGLLDFIPDDAAGAVVLHDIAAVKKKGDKLAEDAELPKDARPTELFKVVCDFLGIHKGIDESRPVALLYVHNKYGADGGRNLNQQLSRLVLMVPFTDRDKMGENFGLKAGDLKTDKIIKADVRNIPGTFVAVRDDYVLLGTHEAAVQSVIKRTPVTKTLPADRVRALNGADLLVFLNPKVAVEFNLSKELENEEKRLADTYKGISEDDRRQLFEALGSLQFIFLAMRFDDGLHISNLNTFTKDLPDSAKKFLTRLEGGPGASDLAGLPEGVVVAAQGARGDGAQSAFLIRLLFHYLLQNSPLAQRVPFFTDYLDPSQRLTVAGVVAEVWKKLQGHRAAIYRNAEPTKQGLFNVVAILDTNDTARFLGEIKQLARFSGAGPIDLTDKTAAKDDLQTVKQLLEDLDDRRFETRETASTKLELIGEPVLPHLEALLKAKPSLEVLRRAEAIKSRIVAAALERRKGLFSDVSRRLQPSFDYVARGEKLEGVEVDVLHIKLADRDVPAAKHFRQLFGPDWNRVRVAVHGKQVVLLWGSDRTLLPAALTNLKDGKRGLADAKHLAPFARDADAGRKIEFHAAVEAITGLARAEDLKQPDAMKTVPAISSMALTVGPDRIQYDLRLPARELRFLIKELRSPAPQ
ncbi:MAG: hypothetical protein K2R98_11980 [Gemmataceae bacterium]|nr:hypothetical protein [Gemmataceae bacterium]